MNAGRPAGPALGETMEKEAFLRLPEAKRELLLKKGKEAYVRYPFEDITIRFLTGELGIDLKEGVYMYFPGPQYETPAEVRFARIAGADAVGMSTAPEVIVAGHCGMQVLGFTLCSNMAAGILDQPLSEQEVLDAAEACKEKFSRLVLACLKKLS